MHKSGILSIHPAFYLASAADGVAVPPPARDVVQPPVFVTATLKRK